MAGHDCQRWRDAFGHAFANGGASSIVSTGRQELTTGNGLNEKSTMRRLKRLIAASVLVALSGALAGCSTGMSSFDPMDWLDWLGNQKKKQGDRKPVFPDGVPGLEQGVPKSLYKGAQQEPDPNAQQEAAVPPPPPDTKSKKTAKKGKQQPAAATASTDPAAAPEEDNTAAAPPAPKKKIVRQRTTAPPPDQDAQQSGATQPAPTAQQSGAAFPAPVPGGTFTR